MITISLDEAGVFDAGQKAEFFDSKTTLIGGYLFDDHDAENETEYEKARIKAFYIAAINDAKSTNSGIDARYPSALHSGGKADKDAVKAVKAEISRNLPEFLKEGTYKGEDLTDEYGVVIPRREGRYHICAIVKSAYGKAHLASNGLNDFVKDGKASNLYFHMASEATSRFIFHNPLYSKINSLSCHIATKSSANIGAEFVEEYKNAGFSNPREIESKNDNSFNRIIIPGFEDTGKEYMYSVMNEDIFRTLVAEQLTAVKANKVSISEFNVTSINYNPKSNKEAEYAFLYMADTICSYLTFKIGENDLDEVFKRSNELSDDGNLVFAYDMADVVFGNAIAAYEKEYYYDALSYIYDISIRADRISEYYYRNWGPFVVDAITQNAGITGIERAFNMLHESIMTSNFDNMRAKFIFDSLKGLYNRLKNDRLRYLYNDIGVTLYCHMGDTKSVRPYFENCQQLSGNADYEEYIRTRNRYATALCDALDHKGALEVVNITIDALKELCEASKRAFVNAKKPFGLEELAKSMSLKGQVLSFMKDDKAEDEFKEALELIGRDTPNYLITESYLLHYYINSARRDDYISSLKSYCGGLEDHKEQLEYIFRNSTGSDAAFSLKYALLLYLKGAYMFLDSSDLNTIYKMALEKIKKLEGFAKKGHPWELIYKYIVLIGLRLNADKNQIEAYEKSLTSCVAASDTLIDFIMHKAKIDVMDAKGNREEADIEVKKLAESMQNFYETFYEGQLPDNSEELREILNYKLTYMYS